MVGLAGLVGGDAAHVMVGDADVWVARQIGPGVVAHHVLLSPHERRHPDLHHSRKHTLEKFCPTTHQIPAHVAGKKGSTGPHDGYSLWTDV